MSVQDVYNRLHAAPLYHPSSVELFDDITLQAGDVVTVQSGNNDYALPIYSQHLFWNGTGMVSLESTGNEKREPLPALRRKQYAQGSSAYKAQKETEAWIETFENTDLYVNRDSIWAVSALYDIYNDGQGNQHIRLKDGALLEIKRDGVYETVASVVSSQDVSIGALELWVDTYEGTAIYRNRDSISAVCGEFTVVTVGNTKTLKVKNGTGLVMTRNNTEYGIYDEGSLTAGVVVTKLNNQVGGQSTYTKILADVVDLGAYATATTIAATYATIGDLNATNARIENITVREGNAVYLQSNKVYALDNLYIGYTHQGQGTGTLTYRGTVYGARGIVMGSPYFIEGNALMKDPSSTSPLNLNHYHTIVATEGTGADAGKIIITLTDPVSTSDTTNHTTNFNIAATTAYQNGVLAARNAVKVNAFISEPRPYGLNDHNTFTYTTDAPTPASGTSQVDTWYLVGGTSWNNNATVVYMRYGSTTGTNYAQIDVDASTVYTSGLYDYYHSSYWEAASASNGWTVSVPNVTNTAAETWNAGVTAARNAVGINTFTADPRTQLDDHRKFTYTTNAPSPASGTSREDTWYLTGGTSWSSNKTTVSLRYGSTSGTEYAKLQVDASALVTNATNAGKAAVTLSSTLTWSTTPSSSITANQNAVTISTSGRTNTSGTADEKTKTVNLYSSASTNGLTATFYVTHTDSTAANRIIKRTATCSDSNLVAGNIKSGVSIFGVTGTYNASVSGSDIQIGSYNNVSSEPSGTEANTMKATILAAINNHNWFRFKVTVSGTSAEKYYKMKFD